MNPNNTPISFGTWLKHQRQKRNWTQDELAVQINSARITVRRYEAGERKPPTEVVELLADLFSVPADERVDFSNWARQVSAPIPPASVSGSPTSNPNHNKPPVITLPIPPTTLIGRDTETAEVLALLTRQDIRLLTLIGPGGIGKTRLALAVAQVAESQFRRGIVLVQLGSIRDPSLVLPTIIQAMEANGSSASILDAQRLLVLDNFEHLLGAGSDIGELIEGDPNLKVLITSREVLHIYGEHEYNVEPLGLPELWPLSPLQDLEQIPSIRLFVQRAQAVRPDFNLTEENAPLVAAICHHMDGLPLALELAAARIKSYTPDALLTRLGERFKLLTGGPRNMPDRQQTLHNVFAWSYNLLEPAEQRLFAQLSVFAGGFTPEAAEAVCGLEQTDELLMIDRLVALADKSLLRQGAGVHGEPRFGMLQSIREYARVQLQLMDVSDDVHRRHADYFVHYVETLPEQHLEIEVEMAYVSLEKANIHALLNWAEEHNYMDTVARVGSALWLMGMGAHLESAAAAGWEFAL